MTNREWLKSLNNEELSHFLNSSFRSDIVCYGCRYCPYYNEKSDELSDCDDCLSYWLKQEHKEDVV